MFRQFLLCAEWFRAIIACIIYYFWSFNLTRHTVLFVVVGFFLIWLCWESLVTYTKKNLSCLLSCLLLMYRRPLKTRDRRDRGSCQEGWCLCQIVVSWDLFFGACHFCSMKTVDLATSYLFSLSALTAFIVFYCYCMLGKVTQHSISVYFCMLFIILLLYAHK